jgi:hypothetical protein
MTMKPTMIVSTPIARKKKSHFVKFGTGDSVNDAATQDLGQGVADVKK